MTSSAGSSGPGPANGGTERMSTDADLLHLVHRRDLVVPDEDRQPLGEYWTKIRLLRAQIDEHALADSEIAITWTAVSPDAE